jgi:hypothetical protein
MTIKTVIYVADVLWSGIIFKVTLLQYVASWVFCCWWNLESGVWSLESGEAGRGKWDKRHFRPPPPSNDHANALAFSVCVSEYAAQQPNKIRREKKSYTIVILLSNCSALYVSWKEIFVCTVFTVFDILRGELCFVFGILFFFMIKRSFKFWNTVHGTYVPGFNMNLIFTGEFN